MPRALSIGLVLCLVPSLILLAANAEGFFEDVRVQQAFVAGCFLAAGWFVSFAFREIATLVDRYQRSLDIQIALRGEIFDYSEALSDDDPDATAEDVCKKVREGGDDATTAYHPFVPRVSSPIIFPGFVHEVPLLPEETIDTVVQFYSVLSDVIIMSEDLGSDRFHACKAIQREGALRDYMSIRKAALGLARESDEKLTASIARDRSGKLRRMLGLHPKNI